MGCPPRAERDLLFNSNCFRVGGVLYPAPGAHPVRTRIGARAKPLTRMPNLVTKLPDQGTPTGTGGLDAGEGGLRLRGTREPAGIEGFLAQVEHRAYRIARHGVWDHELALEIVQDSMMKLVEKYAERPPKEWAALFYTILNNRVNDARRRRLVREKAGRIVSLFAPRRDSDQSIEVDILETESSASADPRQEPEAWTRNRQLQMAIDAAVSKLPPRQRDVFLLREWQGLDVRETAQVLGCSQGSVKQHHFRAMQSLRRQLAEVWNDDD